MDAAIERLFPAFDELYPEVRLTLTGAERMYRSFKEAQSRATRPGPLPSSATGSCSGRPWRHDGG